MKIRLENVVKTFDTFRAVRDVLQRALQERVVDAVG
ncbi:MAG: sulfate ABC transporter ATP-binding protein, partial [Rhizobium pusense]|nr:sulfate ABC transporter ATP-binding protein [Agrobacterium pusense]